MAEIVQLPLGSCVAVVWYVALPSAFTAVVPSTIVCATLAGSMRSTTANDPAALRRKVTLPVGTRPGTAEVTSAVNVTRVPKLDGFGADVTEVVVGAGLTTCTVLNDPEVSRASPP